MRDKMIDIENYLEIRIRYLKAKNSTDGKLNEQRIDELVLLESIIKTNNDKPSKLEKEVNKFLNIIKM